MVNCCYKGKEMRSRPDSDREVNSHHGFIPILILDSVANEQEIYRHFKNKFQIGHIIFHDVMINL